MATPREFIKAWQESSSLAEVASKTSTNKNACRVRAWRYQNLYGVPLKVFAPVEPPPPTDWGELAEYAVQFVGRQAGESA
jgi:hypothetical protein